MAKIITFGTLKGGVGKTMLCFNIGGIVSQLGKRVLVIDSDLQGNLTNNMGIDRTSADLLTTYDIYNIETDQPDPQALVVRQPARYDRRVDLPAQSGAENSIRRRARTDPLKLSGRQPGIF